MRFTSIEIKNFRQYKSLELNFPKRTDHDLHIIIADNGIGKTNILNAITWCLYGEEPHLGNSSKSLPKVNLAALQEASDNGDLKIDVTVSIHAEDDGNQIIFIRKASFSVETEFESKSELTVLHNDGSGDILESEEKASEYVEKYMPKRIQEYFYFDGEQLDNYFMDDDNNKIRETIHNISQVDVVTRVKQRLSEVAASLKVNAGKKRPDIKALNQDIAKIDSQLKQVTDTISELDRQILLSQQIIRKNSEYLKGSEDIPGLEQRYNELVQQHSDLEAKVSSCYNQLYAFIRNAKIALSFYPYAQNTLTLISEKEKAHALPPDIDKKTLIQLLQNPDGRCTVCNQPLSIHARKYIEDLIGKIQVSSETSNILMRIRSELERVIEAGDTYPKTKEQLLNNLKDVENALELCDKELAEKDAAIQKVSDTEQVIKWHTERQQHQELLEKNKNMRAVASYQLDELQKNREQIEKELDKALEKDKEFHHINSLLQLAKNSQQIVTSIESEMMAEVREQMESRTMDYFRKLIWKKDVYDHITLNEKYQLDLIHRNGYSCVGSCSAAERSLLALSFTLALHEVSGFSALLFIDTPVSRVSGENRSNFAKVLKEVSLEKQLIMAFTPDEYSESVSSVFQPISSSSVILKMNATNDITSIK